MPLRLSVTDLKRAGFSDDVIMTHIEDMRPTLRAANFSEKEIDDYYGIVRIDKPLEPPTQNTSLLGVNNTSKDIEVDTKKSHPLDSTTLTSTQQQIASGKTNEELPIAGEGILNLDANKVKTETEAIANTEIEDPKIFDHNQAAYENRRTDIQDLEQKAQAERLKEGSAFLDELSDEQVNRYYKDGGNLEIDGKKIEVINRVKKYNVDGAPETEILNTFDTTGTYTKMGLMKIEQSLDATDIQLINLNEGLSFIASYESNNANIRSRNDDKGGLFQIPDVEVPELLDLIANDFAAIDPSWAAPQWFHLAYSHKDATKLPVEFQRALALKKLTKNPNATTLLKQAMDGNEQAWIDLVNNYYNADGLTVPEASERLESYFSKFNTSDYRFVNGAKAFFADRDDTSWAGWVTRVTEDKFGKTFVRNLGGQGHINVFGSGGGDLSVDGLAKIWSTQIDEYGYTPEEAYINVMMLQNHNFSLDLIEELRRFTEGGDWKYGAGGALTGAAIGGTITVSTGGFGAILLPSFIIGGGYGAIETMRTRYGDMIMNGEANTPDEFWDTMISFQTAKEYAKNTTVGTASAGTGFYLHKKGLKTAAIAGEISTFVGLQSLLSQTMPTKEEFAQVSAMVFGFASASRGMRKMTEYYKKYGIKPADFLRLSKDPNFRAEIYDLDKMTFDPIDNINDQMIQIAENKTNIILTPNPKHELNTVVETSASGTEVGRIVDVRKDDFGSTILKLDKDGEEIYVKEAETSPALKDNDYEIEIDADEYVTIQRSVLAGFKEKQNNRQFNDDIIEYRTDKENLPLNNELLDGEFSKFGTEKNGIATRSIVGSHKMFVDKKTYPELADVIKRNTTKATKYNTKSEFLSKNFKNINNKKSTLVDEVFAVKRNGYSRFNFDAMILREKQRYFAIPLNIYESLKTKPKQTVRFQFVNNVLVVTNDLDNKIVAAVRVQQITGPLKYQADSYYRNYVRNNDKVYTTNAYANRSDGKDDFLQMPDEIPINENLSELPNMPRFNPHANMLYNSAKGLTTFDLIELSRALMKNPVIMGKTGTAYGFFRSLADKIDIETGELVRGGTREQQRDVMQIVLQREIQANPKLFTTVLAHEIGHLVDYIGKNPEDYTLSRGNILGRLVALRQFLNEFIDPDGVGSSGLTREELVNLRKEAEAFAAKEIKRTEEVLSSKYGITPDILRRVYTDAQIKELIDPDIYSELVKLSNELKVAIGRDAIKNMVNPYVDKIIAKIKGEKTNTKTDKEFQARAMEIFAKNVEKTMRERGLIRASDVKKELIRLTERWHPYNKEKLARTASGRAFIKYRESSKELMAEFMMAFLTRPRWTMANAPKASELFVKYLQERKEVADVYNEIQADINARAATGGSTIIANKIIKHFITADKRLAEQTQNLWQRSKGKGLSHQFYIDYVDTSAWMYKSAYKLARGQNAMDHKTGKYIKYSRRINTDFLEAINEIERYTYKNSVQQYYTDSMINKVLRPLTNLDSSHNRYSLALMLLLKNLGTSAQRANVANPYGLWTDIQKFIKLGTDDDITIARQEGIMISKRDIDEYVNEGRTPFDLYQDYRKVHPELGKLADKFGEVRDEIMRRLIEESGAFSARELEDMFRNYSYITFNPIDKALVNLEATAGFTLAAASFNRGTKGDITDIVNPLDATMEKDLMLIGMLIRNSAVVKTIRALEGNKTALEQLDSPMMAKKGLPEWKDRIITRLKKDKNGKPIDVPRELQRGTEIISWRERGKVQYARINEYAKAAIDRDPYRAINEIEFGLGGSMAIYRYIWTEINPTFWVTQTLQDIQRTYKNIPEIKLLGKHGFLKYMLKNMPRAYRLAKGHYDDVTRDMMTQGFLISNADGYRGQAGLKRLDEARKRGDLTDEQYDLETFLQKMDDKEFIKTQNNISTFLKRVSDVAWTAERLTKIAAYDLMKDLQKEGKITYTKEEVKQIIRQRGGGPHLAVKGKKAVLANGIFTFFNAILRGWEGDYRSFRANPMNWMFKQSIIMGPKLLEIAARFGLFGAAIYAYSKSISQYDQDNFINIPIADFTDKENSNVEYGKLVYLRIPLDPTGRLFNGLLNQTADAIAGTPERGSVGSRIIDGLVNETFPTFNPIITGTQDLVQFLSGNNVYDEYSNSVAIDQNVMRRGGREKNIEILRYFYNNYGPSTLYRLETNNEDEILTELEELLNYPVGQSLGKFIRVGDYPIADDIREMKIIADEFRNDVDLYAQRAIKKIILGESDKITDKENQALYIKNPDLANNKGILRELISEAELPDFVFDIVTETDKKVRENLWHIYIEEHAADPDKARRLQEYFEN